MEKKLASVLTCGVLAMGLVGCGSEEKTATNSTPKNEVKTEEAVKDATVIRGTGAPRLTSAPPMIPLEKGKATLKVNVKGADKSKEFSASVIKHLEQGGSATSIADVSRKGNLPDSESFDVPSQGNYDINLSSDDDFKGDWEVVIEQKQKKDKEYDQQLRLTSITQQIGGEFPSSISPKNGYGSVMSNLTITDKNAISFQSVKEGNFVVTEMKNGKWTTVEKVTGKTEDERNKVLYPNTKANHLRNVTTTKGPGELLSYDGKHYIVLEEVNASPVDVTIPDELSTLLNKNDLKDVYWDFDNKIVYTLLIDRSSNEKSKSMLYRYDLQKQKLISNGDGKQTTTVPFNPSSERMRFTSDKKGNLYIASLTGTDSSGNNTNGVNPYAVTVVVFNKDMKMITKPTIVNAIYDYYGKGRFEIAATDKGLDIWNVYDARLVNGSNSAEPLTVGANRFSLTLE
ncbi:hypothetical protein [Bacillus bombysepticus]|uniref:hypothetical protein n=1 Tax=Bacillus bombysepticus TaxID=658666 RepID=UPI00301B3786